MGSGIVSLICCCKSGCFLSFVFFLLFVGWWQLWGRKQRMLFLSFRQGCTSGCSDMGCAAFGCLEVDLWSWMKTDGKGFTWCIWVGADLLVVGSDEWRLRVPAKLFRQWTMSMAHHYKAALPLISFLLINYRSKRTSKRKEEEGEGSPLPPAIVPPLLVPRSFLPRLILTHLL